MRYRSDPCLECMSGIDIHSENPSNLPMLQIHFLTFSVFDYVLKKCSFERILFGRFFFFLFKAILKKQVKQKVFSQSVNTC